jgi:hypothetical protein
MRVTMLVRNTDGLKAKLRTRTERKKARIRQTTAEEGQAVLEIADELCNVDTGYMRSQLKLKITRDGYNFAVGFWAEDFVGKVNPATGKVIQVFYPPFPILGTRFMAGFDFLSAALRIRKSALREGYRAALRS